MTPLRWPVLLFAAALATAGCIGTGGDDVNNTTDQPPFGFDQGGNNTTDSDTRWETHTKNGTVQGANAVVASSSAEEQVTVADGALVMGVNVTAEGGELTVTLVPPDCEDASCESSQDTSNGNLTMIVDGPESGEWTIRLEPADPGPANIEYRMVVGVQLPAG